MSMGKLRLVVEGIKTQLEDEMLSRFETLTNQRHEYGMQKLNWLAAISQESSELYADVPFGWDTGTWAWVLLVIQQVLSVSKHETQQDRSTASLQQGIYFASFTPLCKPSPATDRLRSAGQLGVKYQSWGIQSSVL